MGEAFNIAFAVLLSVGGGGAIVFALSSWLGRVWATRILEKERSNYSEQLEDLKRRLELRLHLGKVLFDAEFNIYRELWTRANNLRMSTMNTRSGLRKSALNDDQHNGHTSSFKKNLARLNTS